MKTGEKLQKLITLLVTWALLLALFLAYERYFVTSQQAFLKETEFHAVERLARELDAQIQRARISTVSYVQLAAGDNPLKDRQLADFLRIYFKDTWSGNHNDETRDKSIKTAKECLVKDGPVTLESEPKGLTLTLSCIKNDALASSKFQTMTPLYTLDLAPWINKAFEPLGSDFDDVLIADAATGETLFQKAPDRPRVANLRSLPLDEAGDSKQKSPKSTPIDNSSGDATQGSTQKAQADDKQLQKLMDTSFFTHTTLGGQGYELFSVPVRIQLNTAGRNWNLAVVGLQRSESFEAQSHAIPYSTMIWVTLIAAAVFSLSWPVAKLRYMSNTERFTTKEGWLLVLTIFLAATSVTLMLLNATYTTRSQGHVDRNLAVLARQIKAHFAREMKLASAQMEGFTPDEPGQPNTDKIPDYLGTGKQSFITYPYFEIAFWVKRNGWQFRKFDIRPAPTPVVFVGNLPFFSKVSLEKVAKEGEKSSVTADLNKNDPAVSPYYFDPELSLTTNQFAPVLAAPTHNSNGEPSVKAIVVRPMSLVDPVLPPGYGFAVIDASCQVLFHLESFRDMKENFCQESKGTAELKPWLFAATDSPIDISYAGKPARAFITSMNSIHMEDTMPQFAGGPAYLVVFRNADYALTLNLAIIVVCSILLGGYFVVLLILIGVDISLRGPLQIITAPRQMWPCVENGFRYVQVFVANCVLLMLYWLFYPRLYEAPLLGLTLLVAVFSALLLFLKLSCQARVLFCFGMLLLAASFAGFLTIIPHLPSGKTISWSEWWKSWNNWCMVLIFVGIAGAVAIVISRPGQFVGSLAKRLPRLSAWIRRVATDRFAIAYSLAVITVITGASMVPCIGCFKFAYDMVNEMALKHDEIALSKSYLARQDRIRSYYLELIPIPVHAGEKSGEEFTEDAKTRIEQTAQGRLKETLDRYDIYYKCAPFGFNYPNEPTQDCNSNPTPNLEEPKRKPTTGFNERLEKLIAEMVLYFPANRLGAETSKLGVAATDESGTNADYQFEEPEPNFFRLSWRRGSNSNLPSNFTVEAAYIKWNGFLWWGKALMLLLWIVLSLWLTSLVRKIFLTDVQKPRESADDRWEKEFDISGNYLVVGLAESGKSEALRSIDGILPEDYFDLRVVLRSLAPDSSYPHPSSEGAVVLLDHFEVNLNDRDANLTRLNLLEYLLYETNCRILLVSSVDPLYYLTEGAPDVLADPGKPELSRQLLDRWARVFSNVQKVHWEGAKDEAFTQQVNEFLRDHEDHSQFASLVIEECDHTARLRRIGISILKGFDESVPVTKNVVTSLVLDRASEYYRVLWSGLTASERLVLYQLALDGWANPKSTAALQQLESKLLIRRMPMFRIMNMSFRGFVASPEHINEIEQWEKQQKQSTWRLLRLVLIGLFLMLAVWLLHSQAALSQELAAFIAGVATLLTAISTLFSRSGKQTPDRPDQR